VLPVPRGQHPHGHGEIFRTLFVTEGDSLSGTGLIRHNSMLRQIVGKDLRRIE
jgi:hypothetical protein